jgi:hypothetical protein
MVSGEILEHMLIVWHREPRIQLCDGAVAPTALHPREEVSRGLVSCIPLLTRFAGPVGRREPCP